MLPEVTALIAIKSACMLSLGADKLCIPCRQTLMALPFMNTFAAEPVTHCCDYLYPHAFAKHVKVQTEPKLCSCTLASKELLKDVKGAAIGFTTLASHTPHTTLQPCFPIPVATFSSSVTMNA